MENEPLTKDFDFLTYISGLEKRLWANYYSGASSGPKHPGNVGITRELFIKDILQKFIPNTVYIGSGEITNGKVRSRQQDIVLYRNDFPILKMDGVDLFLIEGVLATIEVKSDFKNGELNKAFNNVKSVISIEHRALEIKGSPTDLIKLQQIHSPKTFVFGYKGWSSLDNFYEKYSKTIDQVGILGIPTCVFQPEACAIQNNVYANFGLDNLGLREHIDYNLPLIGFLSQNSFAFFFQQLLRSIMFRLSLSATSPGINAEMQYDFMNYFSLPDSVIEKRIFGEWIDNKIVLYYPNLKNGEILKPHF